MDVSHSAPTSADQDAFYKTIDSIKVQGTKADDWVSVDMHYNNGNPPDQDLFTQQEYEGLKKKNPKLNLPELPDGPRSTASASSSGSSGSGNTSGKVTAITTASGGSAHEAAPVVKTQTEEEEGIWDSIKNWMTGAGDKVEAAANHPVEGGKGAAKGMWNMVPDMATMMAQGSAYQMAGEMEQNAAILSLFGMDEQAKAQQTMGQAVRDNASNINFDEYRLEMSNKAQEGGDLIATIAGFATGVGGVIKLGGRATVKGLGGGAAKVMRKEASEVEAVAKLDSTSGKVTTSDGGKITPNKTKETGVEKKKHTDADQKKDGVDDSVSTSASEPVDVASGNYLQNLPMIALPGTLPLNLSRDYRSRSTVGGMFGDKWMDEWSQCLELDKDQIRFINAEGMTLIYSAPAIRDNVYGLNIQRGEYHLQGSRSGVLTIFNRKTQQTLHFAQQRGQRRCLSAITDRSGNRVTFHYHHDQLSTVEHSDGYHLALSWQQQRVSTIDLITDGQCQRLVTCRYSEAGRLIECDTFQFTHLWHEYTAEGYMTRWYDTDQTDVHYQYDDEGRVIALREASGYYSDRFIYDTAARCTTYLDSEGGATRYWYDDNGLVTREVDPLGRERHTEWDVSNKLSETDALGRTTRYRYNPYGEVVQLTTPTGEVFRYVYDEQGLISRVTLPDGKRWYFAYTAEGKLHQLTDPQGRLQVYDYDEHGEMVRHLLPDGEAWHYRYDSRRQLHAITAPDGATSQLTQDCFGRLTSWQDALGQTTRFVQSTAHANVEGSLSERWLPDGGRQSVSYDSEKRVASSTDGEGKTTHYEYGPFDLLMAMTRPDGERLTFGYDTLCRLNQVTNAQGQTYRYTRDLAGQVVSETDFTGCTVQYEYDAAGRRIRARYPDNRLVCWHHSLRDDVLSQQVWQCGETQSTLEVATHYAYDPEGRRIRAENPDAVVEFAFDDAGQVVSERLNGREVSHSWDELRGTPQARTVGELGLTYTYGVQGRLTGLQLNGHQPLQLQYDVLGRETQRASPAGFVQASQYTPVGLLAGQMAGQKALPGSAVNRSWHYDQAYNVTGIEDRRWGKTRYYYNANDQIVHADFGGILPLQEQFSYDANLNLAVQGRLSRGSQAEWEQTAQQQQAGRVVQRGECEYHYDAAGRLSEKRTHPDGFRPQIWRYRWDGLNQLRELITPSGVRWRYGYDAFGRRIRKLKVLDGGQTPAAIPGARPKVAGYEYLWSGDQLIEEVPVYADGTVAYDQSIHWLYEPGGMTPVARHERGQLHYVVADALGTPRELLTEQGKVAWANRLSTWGQADVWPLAASNDDILSCNLRFAGQYADDESGLHYNRFRYYDNETGQYLTPDPIGLAGGVNPYGYVHNPVGYIDPLGLVAVDAPGYNVYGLFDPGVKEPYYVGITNDLDRRAIEHAGTGRLTPGASMQPLDRNVTYGQARGYEQYYIEEYKTKTGIIGKDISSTNRGNKYNSFDRSRTDARANAFKDAYNKKSVLKKYKGKCG